MAAQYHDRCAERFRRFASQEEATAEYRNEAFGIASEHEVAATVIRALTPPAPEP